MKSLAMLVLLAVVGVASAQISVPVAITEDPQFFTLDNGIIRALVSRKSGDLISMKHNGVELFATLMKPDGAFDLERDPPGNPGSGRGMTDHHYGFWSHDTVSDRIESKLTIDPKSNGGKRGEVSVKGSSDGKNLGHGPGAPPAGDFAADIEIRYTLGQGETGLYTYCIFEHKPEYPSTDMGEARFCTKLSSVFDWMLVNKDHNFHESKMQTPDYNKYNYTTIQFEHPVFGWAGTQSKTGFFFVNASVEYLTGPPTKVEFLCHSTRTILNYWRSSHYGGGGVDVAQGEHWTKVVGPFMLYVNQGGDPQQLWQDAQEQQKKEAAKWPYEWVSGVDYAHKKDRATIKGQIVLNDSLAKSTRFSELRVGVAHPPYKVPTGRPSATNAPADITWQTDSKHYSFWTKGSDDGTFAIPNVRPGKYHLHAFADDVLGEYLKADLTVEPGKDIDLGKLNWQVVRRGRTVWEIGKVNRSAVEFFKGDDFFHNGLDQFYAQNFPNGTNFVIGKSDYTKDWFFRHTPHAGKPELTPRTITFDMPANASGKAILRLSFAGKQANAVSVAVNDKPVGEAGNLWSDSSLGRNQNRGMWAEREVSFDASILKPGANTIKLSFNGAGVMYDYLRLELDEAATGTTLAD